MEVTVDLAIGPGEQASIVAADTALLQDPFYGKPLLLSSKLDSSLVATGPPPNTTQKPPAIPRSLNAKCCVLPVANCFS